MALSEILVADRRLCILRFLLEDRDYSLNESLLQDALEMLGHAVSRDAVRAEVAWLAEQGLVTTREAGVGGGRSVTVATLTERGADVAKGRAQVPGVKRPSPGTTGH